MKKTLKKQVMAALAMASVFGLAGGVPSQAIDADHVLVKGDAMNGDLVAPEKDGYIYGITGGNAYVDSKTTEEDMWEGPQVVDGGLKGTVSGINDIVSRFGGLVGLDDSIINAVGTVDTILDKTKAAEANTVIDGAAGLHLQNYGHDWVRYYGAVGGDISVNTGLGGSIKVLGTTDILKKATETNIVRNGDVSNQIDSGSVIGGIGGSAAVTVAMSARQQVWEHLLCP